MGQARIIFTDDNEITTIDVVDNVNSISDLINGGGGGGSDLIHQATKTLTDAQIKASPVTPVVIIPSTETLNFSGFPTILPKIVSAFFQLDATSGAYEGDVSSLLIRYGSDANGSLIGASITTDPSANFQRLFMSASAEKQLGTFIITEQNAVSDGFLDNGVSMLMDGSGDVTGGNPANTLIVSVTYYLFNTVTGEFV